MIPVLRETFLDHLRTGDFGLIQAHNPFAVLQNWYRKRFKEGDLSASHGFYLRKPPHITEANGLFITNGMITKNLGDTTKCWVFRFAGLTPAQTSTMNAAADMAVAAGGHYSIGGIMQFGLQFFGIRKKLADESGVFCTEFTGELIDLGGLPYVPGKQPYEIDPSYQLNWFFSAEAAKLGWFLAAFYDGKGGYFASESVCDSNG